MFDPAAPVQRVILTHLRKLYSEKTPLTLYSPKCPDRIVDNAVCFFLRPSPKTVINDNYIRGFDFVQANPDYIGIPLRLGYVINVLGALRVLAGPIAHPAWQFSYDLLRAWMLNDPELAAADPVLQSALITADPLISPPLPVLSAMTLAAFSAHVAALMDNGTFLRGATRRLRDACADLRPPDRILVRFGYCSDKACKGNCPICVGNYDGRTYSAIVDTTNALARLPKTLPVSRKAPAITAPADASATWELTRLLFSRDASEGVEHIACGAPYGNILRVSVGAYLNHLRMHNHPSLVLNYLNWKGEILDKETRVNAADYMRRSVLAHTTPLRLPKTLEDYAALRPDESIIYVSRDALETRYEAATQRQVQRERRKTQAAQAPAPRARRARPVITRGISCGGVDVSVRIIEAPNKAARISGQPRSRCYYYAIPSMPDVSEALDTSTSGVTRPSGSANPVMESLSYTYDGTRFYALDYWRKLSTRVVEDPITGSFEPTHPWTVDVVTGLEQITARYTTFAEMRRDATLEQRQTHAITAIGGVVKGPFAHSELDAIKELVRVREQEKRGGTRLSIEDMQFIATRLAGRSVAGITSQMNDMGFQYAMEHGYEKYLKSGYCVAISGARRMAWYKEGVQWDAPGTPPKKGVKNK
jgi:hypothetical protein